MTGVGKSYGPVKALEGIDLDLRTGEFIVLVGPSGCGKSTLLRLIAGLEEISTGVIEIDGRRVNEMPPSERGIGMVFQDYALYPHMNVRENLAFGLKLRRMPRDQIRERIDEVARMLGLADLLERKPAQLSGGQRQRVAIGRALAKHPAVLLLDEPLSNLDARLRAQTRVDIAKLHRSIGGTTIYVTHDQEEAMTLADRIVVLDRGRIQQVGTPMELYRRPQNRFVAAFMGSPQMNFLEGALRQVEGRAGWEFESVGQRVDVSDAPRPRGAGPYVLGFRSEAARAANEGLCAEVVWIERLGHEMQIVAEVEKQRITLRTSRREEVRFFESLGAGKAFHIQLDLDKLHWFAASGSGQRIAELVSQEGGLRSGTEAPPPGYFPSRSVGARSKGTLPRRSG